MTTKNDRAQRSGPIHIGDALQDVMARARDSVAANGWTSAEQRETSEAERRAAEIADQRGLLMARGVPSKVAEVIATRQLIKTKAVAYVDKFLSAPHEHVLVLAGQKDGSKTTAAGYAISIWPWSKRLERWPWLVPFEHILGPWYHRPSDACPRDELTRMSKRDFMEAELLVLDDVGQEPSDLAMRCGEALDQILKARCDVGLRTIITTNDSELEELLERYSSRASRIAERIAEFAVWGRCPHEGFRDETRRRAVLAAREQSRGL